MRLAVLTQDPAGPVTRHRVRALEPHLRAAGFDVDVHAIPKRIHDRMVLFRALRDADVVLLQRKLFTVAELRMLRRAAKRIVYDFDDAVMYRDPFRGRPKSLVRARRFRAVVRTADLVLAGNDYLAEHARAVGDTAVHVAPTAIDTERYVPGPQRATNGVRVGWIGSRSTRPYLGLIDGALSHAATATKDLTFAVMADRPPNMSFPVDFTPWSEEAEVPFLQSLDVGVMPLSDDDWSRGKCGFKLLQYMACAVPAVASRVGVNVEIARGGGCVVVGPEEFAWAGALCALAENDEQWLPAREYVESTYSTRVIGPSVAASLQELVAAGAAS